MVLLEASSFAGALGAVKLLDSRLRPYFTALATQDSRPAGPYFTTEPEQANNPVHRQQLEQLEEERKLTIEVNRVRRGISRTSLPRIEESLLEEEEEEEAAETATDAATTEATESQTVFEEEEADSVEVNISDEVYSEVNISDEVYSEEMDTTSSGSAEQMPSTTGVKAASPLDALYRRISGSFHCNRCDSDNFSNDFEIRGVQRHRIVSLPVTPNAINRQ